MITCHRLHRETPETAGLHAIYSPNNLKDVLIATILLEFSYIGLYAMIVRGKVSCTLLPLRLLPLGCSLK